MSLRVRSLLTVQGGTFLGDHDHSFEEAEVITFVPFYRYRTDIFSENYTERYSIKICVH